MVEWQTVFKKGICGLQPLYCWDRGFKSRSVHGISCLVYVCLCDIETSILRWLRPELVCCAMEKSTNEISEVVAHFKSRGRPRISTPFCMFRRRRNSTVLIKPKGSFPCSKDPKPLCASWSQFKPPHFVLFSYYFVQFKCVLYVLPILCIFI